MVPEIENPPGSPITKSISTPASLQTIVRFHNGSNMSLHHRVSRLQFYFLSKISNRSLKAATNISNQAIHGLICSEALYKHSSFEVSKFERGC